MTNIVDPKIYRNLYSVENSLSWLENLHLLSIYSHSIMIGIWMRLNTIFSDIKMNIRHLVACDLSSRSSIMICVLIVEPLSVLLLSSSSCGLTASFVDPSFDSSSGLSSRVDCFLNRIWSLLAIELFWLLLSMKSRSTSRPLLLYSLF